MVQWLRIHLAMQGTWVRPLVQDDSTCYRAAKPDHAPVAEPVLRNPGEGYFRLHFNFDFLFLKLNYLGGGVGAMIFSVCCVSY